VYVDNYLIVLAHARALLDSSEAGATEYIDANLRDTGTILSQMALASREVLTVHNIRIGNILTV
jgi:S-adenosyl methyltransferase